MLNLAESGREILDRKRDILLRELRQSVYEAERARDELTETLRRAYKSLGEACMAMGSEAVASAADGSSLEANFRVDFRSIMGVVVPILEHYAEQGVKPDYGFGGTTVELDRAFKEFFRALEYIAELGRAEGTTFQIARDVRRTQRRVNALDHVSIPLYRETVKQIEVVLEEKDREEFVRMKRVKRMVKERKPT